MCNSGFVGSGEECMMQVCDLVCPGSGVNCVLRNGQPICASMAVQDLQNMVSSRKGT